MAHMISSSFSWIFAIRLDNVNEIDGHEHVYALKN